MDAREEIADIQASDAHRHPTLLSELARGKYAGLLIRGVFPREAMQELSDRLERRGGAFPESSFPPQFRAHFLGQALDLAAPSLDGYFEQAERFETAVRAAFASIGDFGERTTRILSALAGGRPVEIPKGPWGKPYAIATIRWMLNGGFIPPHCEREQTIRPPYHHLQGLIRPENMFSYYLMIQTPEAGGELCVSSLRWSDIGASRIINGRTSVADLVEQRPHVKLAPQPGDIVAIDGGARFHWVARCKGARLRWTIGGFVSPAREGRRLLIWS